MTDVFHPPPPLSAMSAHEYILSNVISKEQNLGLIDQFTNLVDNTINFYSARGNDNQQNL